MSIADKLTYLNETKRQLREAINNRGGSLSSADPFRDYVAQLQDLIWNPDLLFRDGVGGAWYDPSDINTLFQDAAGTIPVTADGDPVGLMLDKSGNGKHASQGVAARRPVYQSGYLTFNGVSSSMIISTGLASTPDALYCGYGFASNLQNPQVDLFDLSSDLGRNGMRSLWFNGQWQLQCGSTSPTRTTIPTGVLGEEVVIVQQVMSGAMRGRINGIDCGTVAVDGFKPNTGRSFLGSESSLLSNLQGKIGVLVVVNSTASEETIKLLESYVANKAGVTLP